MSNIGEENVITIRCINPSNNQGTVHFAANHLPLACALGPTGKSFFKMEGDGRSPKGVWHPKKVFYRPDRTKRPRTRLPIHPIKSQDGWCDASNDRNYNRAVTMPYPASAENLWREDELYNLIIVLDHNSCPRIKNRGSAIFMHVAKKDYPATGGCIAINQDELHRLLPSLTRHTRIII